jgi:PII-like signaling protein
MFERMKMLLILVDETDRSDEMPLYEAIVRRAHQMELAGATVQAGIMGFGAQKHVHRKRMFGVSDDRPISIMIVDREEKLRGATAQLRSMVTEGLVLLLDVEAIPPAGAP